MYLLPHVPPGVWSGAKARADREQWDMRDLILCLLDDYGRDRVTPAADPPRHHYQSVTRPERTVVVTHHADRTLQRRFRANYAYESAGNLILLDQFDQVVARFNSAEVATWFIEPEPVA
jgi:hypothetical protein